MLSVVIEDGMLLRRLLGALCVSLSCTSLPAGEPARSVDPSPAAGTEVTRDCPRAQLLERAAISEEVVCLLRQFVQIDTTNPPGNELAAARFLQRVLERDGIGSEIIESAPGRANLMARLEGRERGNALMLMHHLDVVPASADEWSVPPLSGTLKDGYVWGRGSLDDKGGGVAELVTLLLLRRLNIPLQHDVVLLGVADEESGGAVGSRWLTEHRRQSFEDVTYILNEGGAILELPGGKVLYSVELAQKAPLWLRVTARGASGHGSSPRPNTAGAVLVRALARVADHAFPIVVRPEVQAVFSARAAALPPAQRARYEHLQKSLQDPVFRRQFLSDPDDASLVRTTLAITMLSGSSKENVISARASAVLDVRLLPGQDPKLVSAEIARLLAEPSLELEPILSWQAHHSEQDTPLFAAIERLARERDPGAMVSANVIGSFTDCNAFRAVGKTCYGFMPIHVPLSEVERIHGKDERLAVDALSQSVVDLLTLVRSLQAPAGG
jgi:acetylornithine deacetylase/succinyl-diaminopimelate desuccinylase-like protein